MFIATRWNPIYWNTACLIVNSGSLEDSDESLEENDEEIQKKDKAADYGKIAKALGDIISRGIKVSLVDINKSNFSFEPDVENNTILFGMKALSNVGGNVIEQIIAGRPYASFKDFLTRCPLNKTAMISLIKAGAFDKLEENWAKELNIEPRFLIMTYYLYHASDLKNKLTLQNFNGLIQRNLVPESLKLQQQVFEFNKYLKTKKAGKYYKFDSICESFYGKHFNIEELDIINGITCILQTKWDKIYQKEMDAARDWLKDNQEEVLNEFNSLIFKDNWNKYADGNISAWEMQSLCFYYHEHELKDINTKKYGIVNFFNLPEEPEVDYFFKRNGKQIPIYKLHKIVGTIISKNESRSSVDILTTDKKVCTVKFTKEYYAMYARQISEKQDDGTKKVMEKGWMTRGTKIMCTGFRRGDTFQTKTYKSTPSHQLYKITKVYDNGDIEITNDRYDAGI